MDICIKRGAHQIGGSCVEITARNGKRLLVDLGLPLDASGASPELMPDIRHDDTLCGLLISHAHGDHYGLAHYLAADVPVYIGKGALAIIDAINCYTRQKVELDNTVFLKNFKPFTIADTFRVTPYAVDHSAYDAYAFLIEADGARVFYSGDFRAHGRTSALVENLITRPPKRIGVLLMEGSTLGRGDRASLTEDALVGKFEKEFRRTKGVAAVMTSSTNINRITTLYKAAVQAGRELVVPPHVGLITLKTGNRNIPNFLHFPKFRKWKEAPTWRHAISPETILANPGKYVVFLKHSIIETMLANGLFCPDATFIYSMWSGYKDRDGTKATLERIKQSGTRIAPDIHTSGHADIPTLKRFAKAMAATRIVPIHTESPERYRELFGDTVELHDDNETFAV